MVFSSGDNRVTKGTLGQQYAPGLAGTPVKASQVPGTALDTTQPQSHEDHQATTTGVSGAITTHLWVQQNTECSTQSWWFLLICTVSSLHVQAVIQCKHKLDAQGCHMHRA